MSTDYDQFISTKAQAVSDAGFSVDPSSLNAALFPFQRDVVAWAVRRGRAALFCECGMGKTFMQLEWSRIVSAHTGGRVLILTPLAVGAQTAAEARRFGIDAAVSRDGKPAAAITVTNYEALHKFCAEDYVGVVLDESSILKAFSGKTKRQLIETFARTPYRLACTATPAPNDHSELGNHSEFLGVLPGSRMLSRYFINDTSEMGNYRLKGHAEAEFWRWVATWAVCLSRPSDLLNPAGMPHDDAGFNLPPLDVRHVSVPVEKRRIHERGTLFAMNTLNATELHSEMRQTAPARARAVADLVAAEPEHSWTIWCNTNYEADALLEVLPRDAVEVRGNDDDDSKTDKMLGFAEGRYRILITKPSIAGFGMNWQHCDRVAFVGLSYSYEQLYQALRRSWRFGQTREVVAFIVTAETEQGVMDNVMAKQSAHLKMQSAMVAAMRGAQGNRAEPQSAVEVGTMEFETGKDWTLYNGDCVKVVSELAPGSVDFAVFSPPFANLYVYTDTGADMGNCEDDAQFFRHFGYLLAPLHRAMRPGRLVAVHCKNLVNYAGRDGEAGLRDFRGDIIRAMIAAGFAYHSEVCIWKSPVTEMQRTKANGLLHKTIKRDASFSRQGLPDYLCVFRKWPKTDEEAEQHRPVTHTAEGYPVELWQQVASPVWHDIDQMDVLNVQAAREDKDEKHICPLQLEVIRRSIRLWTNPGDVVLSPFTGIGSEGYVALQEGRKFVGAELKPSYFRQACANLRNVTTQATLFDLTA